MAMSVITSVDPDCRGAGVYALVGTDGRRYIGSSVDIEHRLEEHERSLSSGRCSEKFRVAIANGITFRAELLESFDLSRTRLELFQAEHRWLCHFHAVSDGYNSSYSTGGVVRSGDSHSMVYAKPLSAYRDSKRMLRLGVVAGPEEGQRIREAAAAAGESVQGYILKAVRQRMEREQA